MFSFINKNDYSAIFVRVAIRPGRYKICAQAAVGQILRQQRRKGAATAGRRVLLFTSSSRLMTFILLGVVVTTSFHSLTISDYTTIFRF